MLLESETACPMERSGTRVCRAASRLLHGERGFPLPRPGVCRPPLPGGGRPRRRLAARRQRRRGLRGVAPTLAAHAAPGVRPAAHPGGTRHRARGDERLLLPVDRSLAVEYG